MVSGLGLGFNSGRRVCSRVLGAFAVLAKRPAKAAGNPENLDASGRTPEQTDASKQGLPALRIAVGQYPNPRRQTDKSGRLDNEKNGAVQLGIGF
jgi:hypothetical protein